MADDTHPEQARPRALSNAAVLRFAWKRWIRRPGRLAAILAVTLLATVCDLSIPWAVKALTETVSDPVRRADAAWTAWGALTGLYVLFYSFRQTLFRLMNGFAARNMEDLTNEAFQRVQAFSADWHANTFAGSTVRQVSRAMWGLDSVSDTVFLMLGPRGAGADRIVRVAGHQRPLIGAVAAVLISPLCRRQRRAQHALRASGQPRSNALDSKLGGALADAMSGNPTVKSFGAEDRETARLGETTAAWRAPPSRPGRASPMSAC
jgi:ATP-binding cassette subfamily B protein